MAMDGRAEGKRMEEAKASHTLKVEGGRRARQRESGRRGRRRAARDRLCGGCAVSLPLSVSLSLSCSACLCVRCAVWHQALGVPSDCRLPTLNHATASISSTLRLHTDILCATLSSLTAADRLVNSFTSHSCSAAAHALRRSETPHYGLATHSATQPQRHHYK
jgi:hypothetical protein